MRAAATTAHGTDQDPEPGRRWAGAGGAPPTLGVGILGAGPVTQAIHLPTLARLRDVFSVVRVMDVDADVAESVAARVGAAWTTSVEELLADPAVEIVAICSPHQFHAEQVIAASGPSSARSRSP
jgi:predicted dehydrogenase